MLRESLLYLSNAGWAKKSVSKFPPARMTTRRFVAGETLQEGIEAARKLNQKGLLVSLDHLGENVHDEAAAQAATSAYLQLIDAIQQAGLKASCSLKLTQLGLDLGDEICLNNLRQIVTHAKAAGLAVTIDMESTDYTDRTLNIYRQLHTGEGFKNLGTVIQAYLYRSEADMQTLAQEGATIRLCKGAYKEPPELAFPEKADVDANYVKLAKVYMSAENRAQGAYLQLATHDLSIIEQMKQFVTEQNIPRDQFEFQMLYGIRSQTQEELAAQGYRVLVYAPYGTEWYPYFMRRLAERPANVWFIMKNLFSR